MSTDVTISSPDVVDDVGLPDDPTILKAMIRELLKSLHHTERRCEGLEPRLDQLLRRLYGARSEKIGDRRLNGDRIGR